MSQHQCWVQSVTVTQLSVIPLALNILWIKGTIGYVIIPTDVTALNESLCLYKLCLQIRYETSESLWHPCGFMAMLSYCTGSSTLQSEGAGTEDLMSKSHEFQTFTLNLTLAWSWGPNALQALGSSRSTSPQFSITWTNISSCAPGLPRDMNQGTGVGKAGGFPSKAHCWSEPRCLCRCFLMHFYEYHET